MDPTPSSKIETRPVEVPSPAPERNEVQPGVSSDPNALQADSLQTLPRPTSADGSKATSPLWVQRISLVIFVMFCIELGMLLAVLPWTRVWMDNSLLTSYPAIRGVLHMSFVRGAISGLGLVDIWMGIWEAVHYREAKPRA